MTSSQQRAALQRSIWQIANDVRGAVDGWDFKQYVLGTLFYRFISENLPAILKAVMKASIMPRSPMMIKTLQQSKKMPSEPRATLSTPASCLPTSPKALTATKV